MLARSTRVLVAVPLLTLGAIACTSTGATVGATSAHFEAIAPMTPTSRVIGGERIARSGVQTALEALRVFVPHGRFAPSPSSMARPSMPSMSRGVPQVLVDGHLIGDLELLRLIPARDVLAIHLLSGPDAAIRFGPHYDGGAIVVQTMASMRPR